MSYSSGIPTGLPPCDDASQVGRYIETVGEHFTANRFFAGGWAANGSEATTAYANEVMRTATAIHDIESRMARLGCSRCLALGECQRLRAPTYGESKIDTNVRL